MENENVKISVQQYLDNNELLELVYIPYEQKVTICDAILSQVLNKDGFASVDSVLLERVKTQIVIESISNLDLSIVNEDNLNGYDLLSFNNKIEMFKVMAEYEKFEEIIQLRLNDFYNENASIRGYMNYIINKISAKFTLFKNDVSNYVQNLDAQAIAGQLTDIIKEANQKK